MPRLRLDRRRLSMLRATLAAAAAVALTLGVALVGAAPATVRIDAQREQIRTLEAELIGIESRAGEAAGARAAALSRLDALRGEIRDNATDLREARAAYGVAQRRLADRLVAIYADQRPSLVELLLASGGIQSALDAHRALQHISAQDSRVVESLRRTRARLRGARERLVASRAEAERNVQAADAELSRLNGLLAMRRSVLAEARGTLAQLVVAEASRQQAQARVAALASAQRQGEAELRQVAQGSAPAPAAPAHDPVAAAPPAPGVEVHLERIAQCESGGSPTAVSASGLYRGKYQFDPATWQAVGGTGDPAAAPEAEQDRRAAILYRQRGPAPWPVCGR